MMKKALFIAITLLIGYMMLSNSPPSRFPQFNEHAITGGGRYILPQWSPDSRYLAFLQTSPAVLKIHDTQTRLVWNVGTDIFPTHFSWNPNGNLTYLEYRPELRSYELHDVGLRGENDIVIATDLLGLPGDFQWFNDSKRLAIVLGPRPSVLTRPGAEDYSEGIYILDITKETIDILVEPQDLEFEFITSFTIISESSLLIYGSRPDRGPLAMQVVIYDLETKTVQTRITPSQLITHEDMPYMWSGLSDDKNSDWVGGSKWFLTKAYSPGGECYNYSLFFLDVENPDNSFCIPSEGVFGDATISPDLSRISYISVLGPANSYVVIGDVPPDLLDRMGLTGE